MTSNRRIERLTREALGPERRPSYGKVDDNLLRAVGIVILIITVITFASWPREDAGAQARPSASHADKRASVQAAEYTPLY
jgi:hypothetical protein